MSTCLVLYNCQAVTKDWKNPRKGSKVHNWWLPFILWNPLTNTEMTGMRIQQMHNLCIEIYKTLSNLNPPYMQELFKRDSSTYSTRRPNDLKIPKVNQTSYGSRSIKFEGAKLWNHLPEYTKSAENLNIFKKLIKDWTGPSCGCNYCLYTTACK